MLIGRHKLKRALVNSKMKQAGLCRATLEISSQFSSYVPLRTHKSHSATFEVILHLKSSSTGGRFIVKICKIWFGHLGLS